MKKPILGFLTLLDLLKVRIFGKRIPLIIGWAITKKCNYRCKYCGVWKTRSEELSTKDICSIIDEMAGMGVRKITFTGGEPLLRDDIGIIIDYAYSKNISVDMNSNGSLVKEKLPKLRNLSCLKLSLEGPEEIHDKLRQNGSFKHVLEAAQVATTNKIPVVFNTTLNTYNFNYIDYLLGLTEQYNAQIVFQPSTEKILDGSYDNPVSLPPEIYFEAIRKIIERKKGRYKRVIRNSMAGLVHLSKWPNLKKIRCASGLISCRIEPDGSVFHCARIKNIKNLHLDCKKMGFKNAFFRLPPIFCNNCCCALRVEASYIFKLGISALINAYLCEKIF